MRNVLTTYIYLLVYFQENTQHLFSYNGDMVKFGSICSLFVKIHYAAGVWITFPALFTRKYYHLINLYEADDGAS